MCVCMLEEYTVNDSLQTGCEYEERGVSTHVSRT
jgi:hypothetical protein